MSGRKRPLSVRVWRVGVKLDRQRTAPPLYQLNDGATSFGRQRGPAGLLNFTIVFHGFISIVLMETYQGRLAGFPAALAASIRRST